MKWSTLLPLATLSLLPFTGAWEVTWTGPDDQKHSQSGHGPSDCVVIDNPKGHLFKIDAQGETGIDMLLFTNSKCSGKPAGKATEVFSKESSAGLYGFKVVSLSSTTTSATTTTEQSASGAATMSPMTSSSPTASMGSSGSGASMTTQTTAATGPAMTTTSETSSGVSSSTSSAASTSTTNAAVPLAGSTGDIAKGLVGGIFGLAMVQWMI